MFSYYEAKARIRYYGQLPTDVRKSGKQIEPEIVQGQLELSQTYLLVGEDENVSVDSFVQPRPSQTPLDLSRRKEPVHVVFANLIVDVASLYMFTRQWGLLNGSIDEETGEFRIAPEHIHRYQDLLRAAWKSDEGAIDAVASEIKAQIKVTPKHIEIAIFELWHLIGLLFTRDYEAGMTRVCANPDCPAPYFLRQRRGQKYCTHKCAVLMNVRRFREREKRKL